MIEHSALCIVWLEAKDMEELGGIDSFDSSDVSFDSIQGAADPGVWQHDGR